MTAPVIPDRRAERSRPRPRLIALIVYTWRSCFPPKRWAALLLPCAGALLFGLLAHAVEQRPDRAFANVAAEGIFALVIPIAALVIGDSVMGAEVRAGTFHFTWLSPVPTWQIVIGRWIGGSAVALGAIVSAAGLAALVGHNPPSGGAAVVAGAVGSGCFVALFFPI